MLFVMILKAIIAGINTTIVVDKDQAGMPLVNAHTDNSIRRNWEYRDSAAYTANIKYAFIHIAS